LHLRRGDRPCPHQPAESNGVLLRIFVWSQLCSSLHGVAASDSGLRRSAAWALTWSLVVAPLENQAIKNSRFIVPQSVTPSLAR